MFVVVVVVRFGNFCCLISSEDSTRRQTVPLLRTKVARCCTSCIIARCRPICRAPPYLSEHCIPVSSADTWRHLRSYLPYRVSGSTLTAVGRSQLLARWRGTHCWILSGVQRAAQTVLGVYLKRTCSRFTNAFSALGLLNDYAQWRRSWGGSREVKGPLPTFLSGGHV